MQLKADRFEGRGKRVDFRRVTEFENAIRFLRGDRKAAPEFGGRDVRLVHAFDQKEFGSVRGGELQDPFARTRRAVFGRVMVPEAPLERVEHGLVKAFPPFAQRARREFDFGKFRKNEAVRPLGFEFDRVAVAVGKEHAGRLQCLRNA